MLCESMTPARRRSHSASNPTMPVVTSPSSFTSSTSASKPLVATRPHVVNAGPAPSSPPLLRWKVLRSSRSSRLTVWDSASLALLVAHSGSPNGSSSCASGSLAVVPISGIPATVRCEPRPPSSLAVSASTTWLPTVRPKRTIHAFGIGSLFSMLPVAVASAMRAPLGFKSVSVIVSVPSSWTSSSTSISMVFAVSPAAKVRSPDWAT